MEDITTGLSLIFQTQNILLILGGVLIGVLVGALPGLSSPMAIALLIPFTIQLDPVAAIAPVLLLYAIPVPPLNAALTASCSPWKLLNATLPSLTVSLPPVTKFILPFTSTLFDVEPVFKNMFEPVDSICTPTPDAGAVTIPVSSELITTPFSVS